MQVMLNLLLFWHLFIQMEGAKFLGIFPYTVHSSKRVYVALTEELANRGHELTVISPFPKSCNSSNIEHIQISIPTQKSAGPPISMIDLTKFLKRGVEECEEILQQPQIQELVHSTDRRYDAIIVQALRSDCMLGFGHKFNAPVIQLCSFGGTNWMRQRIGSPTSFAYAPSELSNYSDRMNFWERVLNTVKGFYWVILLKYHIVPSNDAVMRKYFKDSIEMPPLWKMLSNISLLLVNNHFTMNYPRPQVPSLIEVGGIHLKPPKELPQDLKEFIESSPDGVIYFSIGSSLKCTNLEEYKIKSFMEAFSKLKQKVLWKWETDYLPGKPKNVKISKWLPQMDILGHPNVRLFITHGGLLSMQEALYIGVPIVGVPIYGDQHLNVKKALISGYATQLDYDNITTESVLWALNTTLLPQYRTNAQQHSRIFRDQPLKPLDKAVYWTEYVVRHKGAPQMRSAALDLTWYQYFLLDVIALLGITIISIFYMIFILFKTLLRNCFMPKVFLEKRSVLFKKKTS